MLRLWRLIRATGRIAEPSPPVGAATVPAAPAVRDAAEVKRALGGSVQIRHVDAGSCNGCEVEIGAAFGPVYDAERYGARLVASPRHADALIVTGVVTRNMAEPLRRTYAAVPAPKLVVACCDRGCGCGCGCGLRLRLRRFLLLSCRHLAMKCHIR